MLEFYFSYRGVHKRLRSGALGAEMDRIASYFSSLGYKRASAKIYLSRIARFGRFAAEHCRSGPISEGIVDGYLGTFTTTGSDWSGVSASTRAASGARTIHCCHTLCSR
jgi:integrase/recombinase XerD